MIYIAYMFMGTGNHSTEGSLGSSRMGSFIFHSKQCLLGQTAGREYIS